jgi:SAM-dependent methyltransferase
MSLRTAEQWDERYGSSEFWAGTEPALFLGQVLPLLPRGRALDLAMGEGRNAVFLARHGWHVTGVDWSGAALEKAAALAENYGVRSDGSPSPGSLMTVQANLENYALPVGEFDVLLCFNYLQRSLLPAMPRALRPGGILVYETYTIDQLEYPEGPRSPDHLLRAGELRAAFASMDIVFYAEHNAGKGVASLLARRAFTMTY